jgi:hypothetical protein
VPCAPTPSRAPATFAFDAPLAFAVVAFVAGVCPTPHAPQTNDDAAIKRTGNHKFRRMKTPPDFSSRNDECGTMK